MTADASPDSVDGLVPGCRAADTCIPSRVNQGIMVATGTLLRTTVIVHHPDVLERTLKGGLVDY